MAKKRTWLTPEEPLRHPDHPRPVTRREFIRQGFMTGTAAVTGGSTLLTSLLLQSQQAHAVQVTQIDPTIATWASNAGCPMGVSGHGKIPFICFDLAGGANIAGSNVMVGGPGGQSDFLSTAGYNKLGIPSNTVPSLGGMTDNTLGLLFHKDSALLKGILTTFTTANNVDGFVIPAVSDNDTNTNPHNPMYGIAKAGVMPNSGTPGLPGYGAKGSLLDLIGSVASVSGGNSMAPTILIDPNLQPTKISKPSDDLGLINTGSLPAGWSGLDVVHTMEAIAQISHATIANPMLRGTSYQNLYQSIDVSANPNSLPSALQKSLFCAYAKAADTANRFNDPSALDPTDAAIQSIFAPAGGLNNNGDYLKTASIMKLVMNGLAGAGTITMGGYDYHTGDRITGDLRDLRAGFCIGACLQYAALVGVPLMVYVFSDGSLFSNGTIDPNSTITDKLSGVSVPPGKGVWTGDNSSTAAAFALMYDPRGVPNVTNRQIGNFMSSGSVNTGATINNVRVTAARDVNSLVYTLLLNYMALHGEQGIFEANFPYHTLGTTGAALDNLIAVGQPLASVTKNSDGTSTIMPALNPTAG